MKYLVCDSWLWHTEEFKTLRLAKKYIKKIAPSDSYIINYIRIKKVFESKEDKNISTQWHIPYKLYKNFSDWIVSNPLKK